MEIIGSLRLWDYGNFLGTIEEARKCGITIFRLNLKTLSSDDEYIALKNHLKAAIDRYGNCISFLLDIAYPHDNPRLVIKNEESNLMMQPGERYPLRFFFESTEFKGDIIYIQANYLNQINDSTKLIYNDGEQVLCIRNENNDLYLSCRNAIRIWSGKPVHFETPLYTSISPSKIQLTKELIKLCGTSLFGISLSYLQDTDQLKKASQLFGLQTFICKIEDHIGVGNIDSICSDGKCGMIFVGRGDLLFSYPGLHVNKIQELCIKTAHAYHTNTMIATDVLRSLNGRLVPSRSDLSDLLYIKSLNPTYIALSNDVMYGGNIKSAASLIKEGYLDFFQTNCD